LTAHRDGLRGLWTLDPLPGGLVGRAPLLIATLLVLFPKGISIFFIQKKNLAFVFSHSLLLQTKRIIRALLQEL
jgi:hypothetical protein